MEKNKSVETICVFIVNENKFLCEKLNKCMLSPCDVFLNLNSSCDNGQKYCHRLKKEHAVTLLNGYIDNTDLSKDYCDDYMNQCKLERIISAKSTFGNIDYFGEHEYFVKKLQNEMGPACDLLENGLKKGDFNCKHLRLCLIGLYIINEKQLNDKQGIINYDRLSRNFLHIMVPCYNDGDIVEIDQFFNEFNNYYDHDCFNENLYSSELGKLICEAVKRYIDILKDEFEYVSISSDISQYIKEQKAEIKNNNYNKEQHGQFDKQQKKCS